MKSFLNFLTEATQSQASMQARKLNLKSDGHGGWLDTRGEFVAKTEKGKLVFYDKGRVEGGKDQPKGAVGRSPAPEKPAAKPKAEPQAAAKPKAPAAQEPATGEMSDTLTVAFGRFNPPTVGHEKLLKAAKKAATGGDLKIYPSRTQDPKKNPLDPDMKISFMKKMFPDFEENIINDDEMRSIFNVLITSAEEGYSNVNIVVGSDRQAEFENLAQKYNGDLYTFDLIRVISAGVRDADAEGVEGMSASKMRKAVVDNDFKSFRRGTNHLICVTEEGYMFKSWIKDLAEYDEKKMERKMRLPGKPNTLVGTGGYFKYVADMTPGFEKGDKTNLQYGAKPYKGYSVSNIREFINKYKVKSK